MLQTTSTLESHSTGALGSIVPFVHSFFWLCFSPDSVRFALKLRAFPGRSRERFAMIPTVHACVRRFRGCARMKDGWDIFTIRHTGWTLFMGKWPLSLGQCYQRKYGFSAQLWACHFIVLFQDLFCYWMMITTCIVHFQIGFLMS